MLTLKQKRHAVKMFKDNKTITVIAVILYVPNGEHSHEAKKVLVEEAIRDYLNGKFSLSKPKPKSRERDYPRRRG